MAETCSCEGNPCVCQDLSMLLEEANKIKDNPPPQVLRLHSNQFVVVPGESYKDPNEKILIMNFVVVSEEDPENAIQLYFGLEEPQAEEFLDQFMVAASQLWASEEDEEDDDFTLG